MAKFSENRNFFKPPSAPPGEFFRAHRRRRAFLSPTEPGDERAIAMGTNDPSERGRRLAILKALGFGPIVVVERASRFDAAGQCWHMSTTLLVHRDVPLDNSERVARELAGFESRTYVLPGFKRLSAFEFWHRHWREDFLEDGRPLISIEDLQRWARPRKVEAPRHRPASMTPQFQGAA